MSSYNYSPLIATSGMGGRKRWHGGVSNPACLKQLGCHRLCCGLEKLTEGIEELVDSHT